MLGRLREWLFGPPLDPFNPKTRQHIVLVAFLAWVGLGADGLSSSCYGPEAAFLALGEHRELGLYMAIATAVTVFIIALAYNQLIELFPSGGGGYKAATKLISPGAGLVSGAALIVDYVLTITISVASGADALFSLLPLEWQTYKLSVEIVLIFLLLVLNLRGMKESVQILLPIFLLFFLSHAALIVYGIGAHADGLPMLIPNTLAETAGLSREMGWIFVAALFLRAYSFGAGTYTGIEAVSNNINMLAEPRVRTGHLTMLYMAASLAFTAGGIILLYLLWTVEPVAGQTLNAVTFRSIIDSVGWEPTISSGVLIAVLASEAGLLLVAANTGFLGGPAVMANMAADMWMPRQFRRLSSRLVAQNGILIMGFAALAVLLLSQGEVALLAVLYSINVFITFSLSLFGMCRHWWAQRRFARHWRRSFALAALGFTVTSFMLITILVEKFTLGGWTTVLITGAVVLFCAGIRRHYESTKTQLSRLDKRYTLPMDWDDSAPSPPLDPAAPTAIFVVGSHYGPGMHTLQWVQKHFPTQFRNFIFVGVGEVDKQSFDGPTSLLTLQTKLNNALLYFRSYCISRGLASASRLALGSDSLKELEEEVSRLTEEFPNSVCFASKLIFDNESYMTRWLHNGLASALQRRLSPAKCEMMIIPIRLPDFGLAS